MSPEENEWFERGLVGIPAVFFLAFGGAKFTTWPSDRQVSFGLIVLGVLVVLAGVGYAVKRMRS